MDVAVAPDQEGAEEAALTLVAHGVDAGVGSAIHAPRGRAGHAAVALSTAPAEVIFVEGAVGHAKVDDVADGCEDRREGGRVGVVGAGVGGV
jgi:hypothetical protein